MCLAYLHTLQLCDYRKQMSSSLAIFSGMIILGHWIQKNIKMWTIAQIWLHCGLNYVSGTPNAYYSKYLVPSLLSSQPVLLLRNQCYYYYLKYWNNHLIPFLYPVLPWSNTSDVYYCRLIFHMLILIEFWSLPCLVCAWWIKDKPIVTTGGFSSQVFNFTFPVFVVSHHTYHVKSHGAYLLSSDNSCVRWQKAQNITMELRYWIEFSAFASGILRYIVTFISIFTTSTSIGKLLLLSLLKILK